MDISLTAIKIGISSTLYVIKVCIEVSEGFPINHICSESFLQIYEEQKAMSLVCLEHGNKITLTTQVLMYLFEVLSGKFIILQPYVE